MDLQNIQYDDNYPQRNIDAYKAAKDFRENQCISSDVILMFDETIEKLLHDASYNLSDVNSNG